MVRFSGLGEAVFLRFIGELLRIGLPPIRFLLPGQQRDDRRFHLVKRTRMRALFLFHLQDVIAKLGGDDAADFVRFQRERGGVKLRHHATAREVSEVAAVFDAADHLARELRFDAQRDLAVAQENAIAFAHGIGQLLKSGADSFGGADDFLVKPFATAELVARIRAVVRRSVQQASDVWTFGELQIEPRSHLARVAGQPLALSPREFRLLLELCREAGTVVSKGVLARRLEPLGDPVDFGAIEVHVSHLRRRIGASRIRTVRGVGYMLVL